MVETLNILTGLPEGEWKITLADGEPGYVILVDQTGKHASLVVRMGEANPYRYGAPPVTADMLADIRKLAAMEPPDLGSYIDWDAVKKEYRRLGAPLVAVDGEVKPAPGYEVKQTPYGMVARSIKPSEEQSGYKPTVERRDV